MKTLSIKQPWAWLICAGPKDVENRGWSTEFRGVFMIHSSTTIDTQGMESIKEKYPELYEKINSNLVLGAIIGQAKLIDCRYRYYDRKDECYSEWHEVGQYGFILTERTLYDKPIPCKGQLGFFEPSLF